MLRVVVVTVVTLVVAGAALDAWAHHDAQGAATRALATAADEFAALDDSDVDDAAYGVPLLGAPSDEELPAVRITEQHADGSFTFEATGERLWRSVCLEQAVSVGTPPARDPEPC